MMSFFENETHRATLEQAVTIVSASHKISQDLGILLPNCGQVGHCVINVQARLGACIFLLQNRATGYCETPAQAVRRTLVQIYAFLLWPLWKNHVRFIKGLPEKGRRIAPTLVGTQNLGGHPRDIFGTYRDIAAPFLSDFSLESALAVTNAILSLGSPYPAPIAEGPFIPPTPPPGGEACPPGYAGMPPNCVPVTAPPGDLEDVFRKKEFLIFAGLILAGLVLLASDWG